MGRRGPPPKPTALKVLQGNPGHRALNEDEPAPPPPPPGGIKPPWWLPAWESQRDARGRKVRSRARRFWGQLAPILDQMGVLTTADPDSLAMLCDVLAEYVEAREIVRRYGMTYESQTMNAHTKRVLNAEEDPDDEEDVFDPNAISVMIRPRPEVRTSSVSWEIGMRTGIMGSAGGWRRSAERDLSAPPAAGARAASATERKGLHFLERDPVPRPAHLPAALPPAT